MPTKIQEGSSVKLDKPKVQEALNALANGLRKRDRDELAEMIENYDLLLRQEWEAEQSEPKKRAARNKL